MEGVVITHRHCTGLYFVPQLNSCLSRACECDLIWKYSLYKYHQIKVRSYWIRMVPNPMTRILEREVGTETHPQQRRWPQASYSHLRVRQAGLESHCWKPRNIKNFQKLPEARRGREGFFTRGKHRVWPYQYLDFGLLASRTRREYIYVVLIQPVLKPVCGNLLC